MLLQSQTSSKTITIRLELSTSYVHSSYQLPVAQRCSNRPMHTQGIVNLSWGLDARS